MDTLEELKYYCREQQPVGALMLTGKWGCGKTYLINNNLITDLQDTHVILRISLFGMESVEEVRNEVKKKWLDTWISEKEPIAGMTEKVKKIVNVIKYAVEKGSEIIPGSWRSVVNGAFSLNAIDFVKVEPKMSDKSVVLIFDDLERTNISTSDLLGCINDYCENLHINTIIVANEEKVKSNKTDKIEYDEIKEKIIQRTIYYHPDYYTVVSNVIENLICNEDESNTHYKLFLKNNEENISAIFSGSNIEEERIDRFVSEKYSGSSGKEFEQEKEKIVELLKRRPYNIRSLKCALRDFGRIYVLLDKKNVSNKERWLFSYLAYVFCFRAGLLSEKSRDGNLFLSKEISIFYPGAYDTHYITAGIEAWIRHGEWNQKILEEEFEKALEREKAISPEDKVRMNRIFDLEESDIIQGYPILLEKAYAGAISLDDYINLLWNSCWARNNSIQIPNIDWERICQGIEHQIENLIQSEANQPRHRKYISEENKEYFLPEEWKAYKMVEDFLSGNILMFKKNKAEYISLIKTEPIQAFIQTHNKRFDKFDTEMANATAEGFINASNAVKNGFVSDFREMWQVNISTQDYKIRLGENGFQLLKELMVQFRDRCMEQSLQISLVHTNRLIEVLDNLIAELGQVEE